MTFDLRAASYEQFERFVFDHPPPTEGAGAVDWFWDALDKAMDDEESYEPPACVPALQVAHLTRLFRDASHLATVYAPEQLCQGFWLLFGAAGGELFQEPMYDPQVPWEARATCFSTLVDLYEGLFAAVWCGDAAYMLFDGLICGHFGYPHPGRRLDAEDLRTRDHIFGVLQRILVVPEESCQRGALHGLGHLMHPGTAEVVDCFLATGKAVNADIAKYASAAKTGDIQ